MTDLRLKGLGTVADTLGIEKMFSLITDEEVRELWDMVSAYFVNANIYDQERQMELYQNQARLREFFGNNKFIKEVYDYCYNLIFKK